MRTSFTNPIQPFTQDLTNCVYLLPSATDEQKFKLGITSHLPARVDSLRKSYGSIDLANAVIIATKNRRVALDLEDVLKKVFSAPTWRAEAVTRTPGLARVRVHNGSTEWYDSKAFEPMVAFVDEVIQRDERSGRCRFTLERRAPWLEAWCQQHRPIRKLRRQSSHDQEAENQRLLAAAEANFRRLQAWVEAHRHQLVVIRPSSFGQEQISGRMFVFQNALCAVDGIDQPYTFDCKELASLCLVSYHQPRGFTTLSYFGSAGPDEVYPSTYSVELIVTEAFERAMTFSPELHEFLQRVQAWICSVQL